MHDTNHSLSLHTLHMVCVCMIVFFLLCYSIFYWACIYILVDTKWFRSNEGWFEWHIASCYYYGCVCHSIYHSRVMYAVIEDMLWVWYLQVSARRIRVIELLIHIIELLRNVRLYRLRYIMITKIFHVIMKYWVILKVKLVLILCSINYM